MADFDLSDVYSSTVDQTRNQESKTGIRPYNREGAFDKGIIEQIEKLKELYELRKKNLEEEGKETEELDKQYEETVKKYNIELTLNKLKDKNSHRIKSELETQKQIKQLQITGLEAEIKLTDNIEDRIEKEEELKKVKKSLKNLNDAENLSANKILTLHENHKKALESMVKLQKEKAKSAHEEYMDLVARKDAGDESITDESIKNAKRLAQSQANKAELTDQFKTLVDGITSKIDSMLKSMDQAIQQGVDTYSNYMGKIDARLQSLTGGKSLDDVIKATNDIFNNSLIDYGTYLENINKLSTEGISYNIEERAFLETVSDKIVASFNTMDATLLRMTRLQQADMTKLMLGNEALLTRLFNEFFEDSSYLATNISDNISASVFEAASTMNQAAASAFEFTVQKWLGALYEVGVSQETVSSIASAINAIGSGDAQGLMNSPVGVLINMAIARGDYSLSDVLTQGLNTEFIDDMMTSMVTLLKDIKDNTTNQVTLQAYSNVLGMSVADVRGFTNITEDDIARLSGYNIDANGAEKEVDYQIKQLENRTTLKEQLDNAVNNFFLKRGMALANDEAAYAIYLLSDLVADLAGDSLIGNVAQGVKLTSSLTASSSSSTNLKDLLGGDILEVFNNALSGLIDTYTDIEEILKTFGNASTLVPFSSGNTYIRYERGKDFIGVSPIYGQYYSTDTDKSGTVSGNLFGEVSQSLSGSVGVTAQNVASSISNYNSNVDNSNTLSTTQERIENLASKVEEVDFFSPESAEVIKNQVTLSDINRELFIEHNYPIWVHFDNETQGFLTGEYDKIRALQHDTHVTNNVKVAQPVTVTGSVSVEGGGYSGASYSIYNSLRDELNSSRQTSYNL